MENVFAAVILIFLFLFGGFTFSSAFFNAQGTVQEAQEQWNSRILDMGGTSISPVDLEVVNAGNQIEVRIRNNGSMRLADFDRWDVFTEYYDNSETPAYQIAQMPYHNTELTGNTWTVGSITSSDDSPESYEAGILNPSEDLVLVLNVVPAVGVGQSAQVTVVTSNGNRATIIGRRNVPPELAPIEEQKVALGGSIVLELLTEDVDNTAEELVYTISTPPTQGTLTPETTFTQAMVDAGEVVYTHTGTEAESFEFTVSDGIETIGPFPMTIALNEAPTLDANIGLTFPSGETAVITGALLHVNDEDDAAEKLIYTIVQFPSNGTLSLGSTFSQAAIDNNQLTYTHTGTEADLFRFVVSDGYDVIGTYTFLLLPLPQQPD